MRYYAEGERGPMTPPAEPWKRLAQPRPAEGYLVFYHSDPASPLAVRDVTRPHTNKSDPNVETGTFGLFSHCMWSARKGVVEKARPYLFFVTRRQDQRVLTGMYRIGWFAKNPPSLDPVKAKRSAADFALAASEAKFIDPPIPMDDIALSARDPWWRVTARGARPLNASRVKTLLALLARKRDVTSKHISEVHRLEQMNYRFTGYRYVDWWRVNGFTTADFPAFLNPPQPILPETYPANTTTMQQPQLECTQCGHVVASQAYLRQCAKCQHVGTFVRRGARSTR